MGSTVFIIPSDVIKSSGYRPQILYTSSGIINPIDPLASAYNLYIDLNNKGDEICTKYYIIMTKFSK